jgi:prepilin-type N-terminal cleavage/methylation domain-containing protein
MRKNGFTLVELLVVITIIAILSTLVAVNYVGALGVAADSRRKADVEAISKAYEVKFQGFYPQLIGSDFQGQTIPKDPYGNDYYNVRALDGSGYKVCTALEQNASIYCNNNASDCYCKVSAQSTIKDPSQITGPGSFLGY